jgi:hypothetical protein
MSTGRSRDQYKTSFEFRVWRFQLPRAVIGSKPLLAELETRNSELETPTYGRYPGPRNGLPASAEVRFPSSTLN